MKLQIVSVGKNLPSWAVEGFLDYQQRFHGKFTLELQEVSLPKRGKNASIPQLKEKEAQDILEKIPANSLIIALDVKGKSFSTPQLAQHLEVWQQQANSASFIIGGPDGLDQKVLQKAHMAWSLSPLTFPHPLARLMVVEQLYRAYAILANHPYHRE